MSTATGEPRCFRARPSCVERSELEVKTARNGAMPMNMMNRSPQRLCTHDDVLNAVIDEIAVSPATVSLVTERYQAIADWLGRDGSTLQGHDPHVYVQGSFALGTAIRPIGDTDAVDVDMVICLRGFAGCAGSGYLTQGQLKCLVGKEIQAYAHARSMKSEPTNKRRCWTLEYADSTSFHVDLLPGIPASDEILKRRLQAFEYDRLMAVDETVRQSVLNITDRDDPGFLDPWATWPVSNPKGYAIWFAGKKLGFLGKEHVRKAIRAHIEGFPDQSGITPLQGAVMLLKRHRDVLFKEREAKPISIIITTLATMAYGGQDTLAATLRVILPEMRRLIHQLGPSSPLPNPSYPAENFADRLDADGLRDLRKWIDSAHADLLTYLNGQRYDQVPVSVVEAMTETTMNKVRKRIAPAAPALLAGTTLAAAEEAKRVMDSGTETKPWYGW